MVVTLLGLLFAILAQNTPLDLVREGNVAYERGDFETAIGFYEQAIARGGGSYVLFYNLGTAYYQDRQPGLALHSYLRAQQINPRDPALSANLARIRAERVDFQGDYVLLIDQLAALTQSTVTLVELGVIVLGLWSLWFVLAALWLIKRVWRRWSTPVLVGVGVLLLLGLLLFVPRSYATMQRPLAVVTSLSAPVMSGPDEAYLEMFQLYAAAEMRVIEKQEGWARFVLPDGRQGWIRGDFIALV